MGRLGTTIFEWLKTVLFSLVFLAGVVLFLASLSFGIRSALAKERVSLRRDPAEIARVQHVKELLGSHYKKVVKVTNKMSDVRKYVSEVTRKSLAKYPKTYQRRSKKIVATVMTQAKKYGLDPIFLVSVIQTESSFNPRARGTSGEIGLMQLMPETGKWIAQAFGIRWRGARTLYDPVMNIKIGAAYLSLLRERFGSDGRLYLPAYNMGPTAVRRAIAEDVMPRDYAKRVMSKYLKNYWEISAQSRSPASHLPDASVLPHSNDDNT